MRTNIAFTSFLWGILLLFGCATPKPALHVVIDSISESSISNRLYWLLPANKAINTDDLQFKEYASYVGRALIKQGFVPAESPEEANVGIFLAYGVSDPQNLQYSVPRMTYSSQHGSGSTMYSGTYTTYSRYMTLNAVDLDEYRQTGKFAQLWKTTVASRGSSDDLRLVFPTLVAASAQYLATDTGKRVEVKIYETDERVAEIKGK